MEEETGKIIRRLKLDNGMELTVYDRSKIMAGDRWLVELLCEAYIPITEKFWQRVPAGDAGHLPAVRKMLGEKLVFASTRKHNFVDIKDREQVLEEMVRRLYDSTLEYLSRPNFPLRLFQKQYSECRRKVLIQDAMDQAKKSASEN